MRHFSPKQLKQHLDSGADPILLDVREPWEYDYCHLSGSELVPMGEIQSVIEELDPDEQTVVICHHGIRSRQVAYYLEQMGFTDVINLDGGIEQWAQDVEPTMKRY